MRLYYIGYGHKGSGKVYTYLGSDNFRTGQQVVVPVFNKAARREYDTMGIIRGTYAADSDVAQKEQNRFKQKGDLYKKSNLKIIKGTDVLELPSAQEKGFTSKAEWTRESKIRHDEIDARARARGRLLTMEA